MTDYAQKLNSLQTKIQQLSAEAEKLETKRLREVDDLLKSFGLLTASPALLAGLFKEAQVALQTNPEQIKAWEQQGERFRKQKCSSSKTETNDSFTSHLPKAGTTHENT